MRPDDRRAAFVVLALLAGLAGLTLVQLARHPARFGDGGGALAAMAAAARVDLNAADAIELAALPGIGPRLAERIVRDRDLHGPFASVEAIDRVPGIGPALVERISPHAIAGAAAGVPSPSWP